MPAPCTEHLSCRLPAPLLPSHVDVVETVHGPTGEVAHRLHVDGEFIGSVVDRGFTAHDGRWIEHWEGFAGGAAVPFPARDLTFDRAVREVVQYCARASFHVRMAVHP